MSKQKITFLFTLYYIEKYETSTKLILACAKNYKNSFRGFTQLKNVKTFRNK